MTVRAYRVTEVIAQQFNFDERPWPPGVYVDAITKSKAEHGVCSKCGRPFAEHASLSLSVGSMVQLCPGSWIVREVGNINAPQIVTAEQYKAHFVEEDPREKD